MLIINGEKLETNALNDSKHKHYDFAKLYDTTMKELRSKHRDYIRFIRPGYPKRCKGADSRGFELPSMMKPTEVLSIPLSANVYLEGTMGQNTWECCLDTPKLLPGNLWGLGRKRRIHIKDDYVVDLKKSPDLAFFLYKISPFIKKNIIRMEDPIFDDKAIGDVNYLITQRKQAVWTMLEDDKKLRTMARAYGISKVDDKQPNAIKQELEVLLEKNDKLQKTNPIIRGTKEFLEEMHFTDGTLLRAFVQRNIDEKKLSYSIDGRWKIGDKIIAQVPANDIKRPAEWLCSYLMTGNNEDKLKEFLHDLLNREYLDELKLEKEWAWLYKLSGENPAFKKKEDIKARVYETFCPLG